MKTKLIKRLNEIVLEIVRANDKELDAIGAELLEIEKKLIKYTEKRKFDYTDTLQYNLKKLKNYYIIYM